MPDKRYKGLEGEVKVAPLLEHLKRCRQTKQIWHKVAVETLREHLRVTPMPELMEEIRAIKDLDLFRYLWEAGLPAPLQRLTLQLLEEVKG